MELFTEYIQEIYDDFNRRVQKDTWIEVINHALDVELMTVREVTESLFDVFMNHSVLPVSVWQYLNERLGWTDMVEELKTTYPAAFIDYVLAQINADGKNDLQYHLFDTNRTLDYDRFIWLFRELASYLDFRTTDGAEELITELEEFGIDHPDYLLERARLLAVRNQPDEALDLLHYIFDNYTEEYENASYFVFVHAFILATFDEPDKLEEAILFFEEILADNPQDMTAKDGLADCYERIGDLEKAFDFTLNSMLEISPYDSYSVNRMVRVANKVAKRYETKMLDEKLTDKEFMQLANAYYFSGKENKTLSFLLSQPPTKDCHLYHGLLAQVYQGQGEYELAWVHALKANDIEPNIRSYWVKADGLLRKGDYESALIAADEGLALEVVGYDKIAVAYLLDFKAQLLLRQKRYEEALLQNDVAMMANNRVPHVFNTRAEILIPLNRLQEAFECAAQSEQILPYSSFPYNLQAEILYLAFKSDDVFRVISRARERDIPIKGKLLYFEWLAKKDKIMEKNGDLQPVLTGLLNLENDKLFRYQDEEKLEESLYTKLLSQIARVYWDMGADTDALLYIDKALEREDVHLEEQLTALWYGFKVNILENLNYFNIALDVALEAYEKYPEDLPTLKNAGRLLSQNNHPERAVAVFEQGYFLEQRDEFILEWLIYCYRTANQLHKAIVHAYEWVNVSGNALAFKTLASLQKLIKGYKEGKKTLLAGLKQHPEDMELLFEIIFYYEDHHQFDLAIPHCEKILQMDEHHKAARIELAYLLTILGRFDEAVRVVHVGQQQRPNDVAYEMRLGLIALEQDDYHKTLAHYEQALIFAKSEGEDFWTEAKIHHRIGYVYANHLNDGEKALIYFTKACELDPKDGYYLEELAFVYEVYVKDYEKALELYKQANALGEITYTLWSLGDVYKKLEQPELAQLHHQAALSKHTITPLSSHDDYVTQAGLLIELGKFEEVETYLLKAETLMKQDGRKTKGACGCVYRMWAKYHMATANDDEALQAIEKGILIEDGLRGRTIKAEILARLEDESGEDTSSH